MREVTGPLESGKHTVDNAHLCLGSVALRAPADWKGQFQPESGKGHFLVAWVRLSQSDDDNNNNDGDDDEEKGITMTVKWRKTYHSIDSM